MGVMTTLSDLHKINKISIARINVALRRLRENIFAVEKQYVLHAYSECVSVCSLSYPASNAHVLPYIVICGLSVSTIF
jgi:hypothetical protein